MKIISLNLQIDNKKLAKVAQFLDAEKADFVFLQEVLVEDDINAADKINNLMEDPFAHIAVDKVETYTTSKGRTYTQAQAVLVRDKLAEVATECLELAPISGDKHTRISQNIQINYYHDEADFPPHPELPSKTYDFANVHFGNRADSWRQLKDTIEHNNQKWRNAIIIGDFNMIRETLMKSKHFWGAQYKSSPEFAQYTSFPSSSEFSQIDFCLIPQSMKFVNIKTFEGLSDHKAILYEIDESGDSDIFNYNLPAKIAENTIL